LEAVHDDVGAGRYRHAGHGARGDHPRIVHKPRLLSDNGSSYVSTDLAEWLEVQNRGHVRGAPYHPQTQGKIERRHQALKNRILMVNYYLPGALILDAARQSCSNEKSSNEIPSRIVACRLN
jgi:transposase InsO family protein